MANKVELFGHPHVHTSIVLCPFYIRSNAIKSPYLSFLLRFFNIGTSSSIFALILLIYTLQYSSKWQQYSMDSSRATCRQTLHSIIFLLWVRKSNFTPFSKVLQLCKVKGKLAEADHPTSFSLRHCISVSTQILQQFPQQLLLQQWWGHLHINESCRSHAADPIYFSRQTDRQARQVPTSCWITSNYCISISTSGLSGLQPPSEGFFFPPPPSPLLCTHH